MMLKLNEFSHNHHPSRVKMLAKYIRRGISVVVKSIIGCIPPEQVIGGAEGDMDVCQQDNAYQQPLKAQL
jgi:hypothetical protein